MPRRPCSSLVLFFLSSVFFDYLLSVGALSPCSLFLPATLGRRLRHFSDTRDVYMRVPKGRYCPMQNIQDYRDHAVVMWVSRSCPSTTSRALICAFHVFGSGIFWNRPNCDCHPLPCLAMTFLVLVVLCSCCSCSSCSSSSSFQWVFFSKVGFADITFVATCALKIDCLSICRLTSSSSSS